MQVVLQRVSRASVRADGVMTGRIGRGLVALVGVGRSSCEADARWLAGKTEALRIFSGEDGRMRHSVAEVAGEVLAISQFTLYGDVRKGRRPSFVQAADPDAGEELYDAYCAALQVPVARGRFGAHMEIDLLADGPVTMILRSEGGRRA